MYDKPADDPDELPDLFRGDDDDEDTMAESYVQSGADSTTARLCAARVLGSSKNKKGLSQPETFLEAFGRGSIVQEALQSRRNLNIEGLCAMDIQTLWPDGTPWGFTIKAHRYDARIMQRDLKPTWLVGSPPCTPFSIWNVGINFKKIDPSRLAAMLEEGRSQLCFCAELYRRQLRDGRHFLHEHPASAISWREP